jgi:hypothetical protein
MFLGGKGAILPGWGANSKLLAAVWYDEGEDLFGFCTENWQN